MMDNRKANGTFRKNKVSFEVDGNGCFICNSHALSNSGYPAMRVNRKYIHLHRFVYSEMYGEIPNGLVIRHKCDNRTCINPEHLEIGTVADNNRDRNERGRTWKPKGEECTNVKLTEQQVIEIKKLLQTKKVKKEIAKEYGITPSTITKINNGSIWSHVKIGDYDE